MDPRTRAMIDQLRGTPEATASLLTGMVAEPLAGLHGLGALAMGKGFGGAADQVERTRQALTFQPRSAAGQGQLEALGRTMEPVSRALEYIPSKVGEIDPGSGAALAGLTAVLDPSKVGRAGRVAKNAATARPGASPRMSAAEAAAAGYWHPIGTGTKLRTPFPEMTFESTPHGSMVPEKTIRPEDIPVGTRLLPAPGDRSDAGRAVTSIGGRELADPVVLEGGQKFLRTHDPVGSAWASGKGVISRLLRRQREAEEGGHPVMLAPITMGHGSMDFNTMMTDALIEQIRAGKLPKSAIQQFDEALRAGTPKEPGRQEWLGLMHPGARAQLDAPGAGALRVPFVNRMGLRESIEAGFPDIAQTRYALTDPTLLDAPLFSGGRNFAHLTPGGQRIENPVMPHSTYEQQLGGRYAGGFGADIAKEDLFPDFFAGRRQRGEPEIGDRRAFELSDVTQVVTPQWQDRLSMLLERLRAEGPGSVR